MHFRYQVRNVFAHAEKLDGIVDVFCCDQALKFLAPAAVAAINGPQDFVEANRTLYRRRRDVMVDSFGKAGWDIPSPKASMFCWAPLPPAFRDMGKRLAAQGYQVTAWRRGLTA